MTYEQAVVLAKKNGYFDALEALYHSVPVGKCSGCTRCCSESVSIGHLEFLHIYAHASQLLDHPYFVERLLKFYIFELVKPMKCPFLSTEGKCEIYDVRPLTCRLFGLADEKTYRHNYQAVMRQNIQTALDIKNTFGYLLPKAVVRNEIGFCSDFKVKKHLNQEALDVFYARRIHLDSQLYFSGLTEEGPQQRDLVSSMMDALFEKVKPQSYSKELLTQLRIDAVQTING